MMRPGNADAPRFSFLHFLRRMDAPFLTDASPDGYLRAKAGPLAARPVAGSLPDVVPCQRPLIGDARKRATNPTGCTLTTQTNVDSRAIKAPTPIDLLTVNALADLLRISRMGVYRLVERRALPFYRVGGVLRFDRGEVVDYLRSRRVGSAHEHTNV